MNPGIYPGMPEKEYHAADGVGSSALARIDKAPAYFHTPITATDAMDIGSIAHCLILDPETLDTRFAVGPNSDRRLKVWRQWAEKQPADKTLLTVDQFERATHMVESIMAHPDARRLIESATGRELSLFWDDGVAQKGRLDLHVPQGAVDLKKTRDASPHGFARAIASYLYHQQAAHYHAGMAAHGLTAERWWWIATESEPPYVVAVYEASQAMLEEGARRRERNLERLRAAQFSGEWPAYESQTLDLPGWAHLSDEWSEAA